MSGPLRAHYPGLKLEEVEEIRRELDAALTPIARKHYLSVGSLLKLAKVGGSVQA
jgi:hypothetical protein